MLCRELMRLDLWWRYKATSSSSIKQKRDFITDTKCVKECKTPVSRSTAGLRGWVAISKTRLRKGNKVKCLGWAEIYQYATLQHWRQKTKQKKVLADEFKFDIYGSNTVRQKRERAASNRQWKMVEIFNRGGILHTVEFPDSCTLWDQRRYKAIRKD